MTVAFALSACTASDGDDASPPVPAGSDTTSATTSETTATAVAAEQQTPTTPAPPPTTRPIPIDDPFFDATGEPPGAPGDIIRARPIDLADPTVTGWQVLAWSRDVRDDPLAVSGVVIAPAARASAPRPVLTWAHGTTGMGDECAPSRAWASGTASEAALLPILQNAGWVFAATDYQGLGTPGDHTYVVGLAEGRNVLDFARAAQRLEGTGATADSPVLAWGHSQGGGAALFAAELAPTYAPELNVIGAMAGAPAAEFGRLESSLDAGPYAGFQLMAAIGFRAAYPELAPDEPPSGEAQQLLDEVRTACVGEILQRFAGQTLAEVLGPDASRRPEVMAVLEANTAGNTATDVPILMYHGEDDEIVPVEVSASVLERYCALDVTAERRTYPGEDHVSVVAAAFGDLVGYAMARLAGEPAPTSCA
jgi:pimeloyl-ACP methyl ester carboxylesterase